MSQGARNWPFFTLTTRPVLAAATSRSVCRHRKAGICSTSTTSATARIAPASCTSVTTGTPSVSRISAKIGSASRGRCRAPPGSGAVRLVEESCRRSRCRAAPAISLSARAISSACARLSSWHGPAMSASGSRCRTGPRRRATIILGFIVIARTMRWGGRTVNRRGRTAGLRRRRFPRGTTSMSPLRCAGTRALSNSRLLRSDRRRRSAAPQCARPCPARAPVFVAGCECRRCRHRNAPARQRNRIAVCRAGALRGAGNTSSISR